MSKSNLKRRALIMRAHEIINGGRLHPFTGIDLSDMDDDRYVHVCRYHNRRTGNGYDNLFTRTDMNRTELIRNQPDRLARTRMREATSDYFHDRLEYFSDISYLNLYK